MKKFWKYLSISSLFATTLFVTTPFILNQQINSTAPTNSINETKTISQPAPINLFKTFNNDFIIKQINGINYWLASDLDINGNIRDVYWVIGGIEDGYTSYRTESNIVLRSQDTDDPQLQNFVNNSIPVTKVFIDIFTSQTAEEIIFANTIKEIRCLEFDTPSLVSIHFPIECDLAIQIPYFNNCSQLKSVFFPQTITNLDSFSPSFENCPKLTTIKLPDNLKKINRFFIKNCSSITSFVIPKNVVEISPQAIDTPNLKYIAFPAYDQKLSPDFRYSSFLSNAPFEIKFYLPETYNTNDPQSTPLLSQNQLPPSIIKNLNYRLASFNDINNSLKNNGKLVLGGNFLLSEDFANNPLVREVSFNKSIDIPAACFKGAPNLQKIIISEAVNVVGYQAFQNCSNVKTLIFEEGVRIIEQQAFYWNNSKISEIVVPKSVQKFITVQNSPPTFPFDIKQITLKNKNVDYNFKTWLPHSLTIEEPGPNDSIIYRTPSSVDFIYSIADFEISEIDAAFLTEPKLLEYLKTELSKKQLFKDPSFKPKEWNLQITEKNDKYLVADYSFIHSEIIDGIVFDQWSTYQIHFPIKKFRCLETDPRLFSNIDWSIYLTNPTAGHELVLKTLQTQINNMPPAEVPHVLKNLKAVYAAGNFSWKYLIKDDVLALYDFYLTNGNLVKEVFGSIYLNIPTVSEPTTAEKQIQASQLNLQNHCIKEVADSANSLLSPAIIVQNKKLFFNGCVSEIQENSIINVSVENFREYLKVNIKLKANSWYDDRGQLATSSNTFSSYITGFRKFQPTGVVSEISATDFGFNPNDIDEVINRNLISPKHIFNHKDVLFTGELQNLTKPEQIYQVIPTKIGTDKISVKITLNSGACFDEYGSVDSHSSFSFEITGFTTVSVPPPAPQPEPPANSSPNQNTLPTVNPEITFTSTQVFYLVLFVVGIMIGIVLIITLIILISKLISIKKTKK